MPLGTLDHTPPPFFRQGPSALTKLAVFSALAVFLMAADSRLKYTQPIRAGIGHRAAADAAQPAGAGGTGRGRQRIPARAAATRSPASATRAPSWWRRPERADPRRAARSENATPARAARPAARAQRARAAPPRCCTKPPIPYSRKVFIDRGSTQGVLLGSPVINDAGVLGQVTRVYPLSSRSRCWPTRTRPFRC